jgi:hypothetical protein
MLHLVQYGWGKSLSVLSSLGTDQVHLLEWYLSSADPGKKKMQIK